VNVPATGSGIPVSLASAGDVSSLSFVIEYDPGLLTVIGANRAAGLPGAATMSVTGLTPGRVEVEIVSTEALAAGKATIVVLNAEVPLTAAYGASHVLQVAEVRVNGSLVQCAGDDGLHAVGFLGDANASGKYESEDAQLVQRVAERRSSGLAAWPLTDPVVVADTDATGTLGYADSTRIFLESLGRDQREIPPLPAAQPAMKVSAPGQYAFLSVSAGQLAAPQAEIRAAEGSPEASPTEPGAEPAEVPARPELVSTGGAPPSSIGERAAQDFAGEPVLDVRAAGYWQAPGAAQRVAAPGAAGTPLVDLSPRWPADIEPFSLRDTETWKSRFVRDGAKPAQPVANAKLRIVVPAAVKAGARAACELSA
jgi:hypothetical protein